jgi:hypothetical protein
VPQRRESSFFHPFLSKRARRKKLLMRSHITNSTKSIVLDILQTRILVAGRDSLRAPVAARPIFSRHASEAMARFLTALRSPLKPAVAGTVRDHQAAANSRENSRLWRASGPSRCWHRATAMSQRPVVVG